MADPVIRTTAVSKRYRRGREDLQALDDVTLRIDAGEFVAVIGPSGCGKTTLLHVIGAMDRASDGEVHLDGHALGRLNDRALTRLRAATIGFVFQEFFLQPTLTALENVLLPTVFRPVANARRRAGELLERVGLQGRATHRPHELSGGEMQRVAIARALINDPRVILADEPTGNLDSANASAVYALLEELHAEGRTIIAVTHSEELAARAARRIHLRDGKIVDDTKMSDQQQRDSRGNVA